MEYLYPGVYLSEVPFRSHPIDGVATSPAGAQAATFDIEPRAAAVPDWTDTNAHDPGVTLLELARWLPWALVFRAAPAPHPGPLPPCGERGCVTRESFPR